MGMFLQKDLGVKLTPVSVPGIFWKTARIGERLSPYVSLCCIAMAVRFFYVEVAMC